MMGKQASTFVVLAVVTCLSVAGCGNKFFDPAQVGRFRPTPAVNIILDSLGVAEETPVAWADAVEPTPSDNMTEGTDYKLRNGDVVRIMIYELLREGDAVTNDYLINESGHISIPEVGLVQAVGLSETELEEKLRSILSPNILPNPTVSCVLVNSQQRQFSIIGDGVARPGRYFIPRHDLRLVDALAMASGASQFNVTNIYVARAPKQTEKTVKAPLALPTAQMPRQGITGHRITPGVNSIPADAADTTMAEFGRVPYHQPVQRSVPSYQSERQLMGMNSGMTNRLWSESQKVIDPRNSYPKSPYQQVVSPSSFAPIPRQQTWSQGYPRQHVMSMSEAQPNTQSKVGVPTSPQIEWVWQNGRWEPIRRGSMPSQTTQQPSGPAISPLNSQPVPPTVQSAQPTQPVQPERPPMESTAGVQWVYENGNWVPKRANQMPQGGPAYEFGEDPKVVPLNGTQTTPDLGWEEAPEPTLIRIPKDRLMAGDPRYNIVIRPGDTIYVPVDVVGEFYIMGNVNRTGTINMTGRPVTLKQAIAMAGGLGPLAYPKNCEIVRRLDEKREEIVMVDLDKIASGEQPDFFIKPHDLINVGTHYSSRWRAVLRNSFRAAWGFGMVYDRNFADDQFGKGFPSWFPL